MPRDFWPMVPLGRLLVQSKEITEIQPDERYCQVTVRLWGQGVVLRDEVGGTRISAKKRRVVRAGQFILSRIDARNGAFGLVPESLHGAIVSNDFPSFDVNNKRLEPRFLQWMSKTEDFVNLCRAASEGTTNRVRLKVDRFLEMSIPLPPLDEQRRIVACVEELAALIEEAQGLRVKASEEVEALFKSTLQDIYGKQFGTLDEWPPLCRIVKRIENGWSPACLPYAANGNDWGVLKVGAVSTGRFVPNENKTLPPHLEPRSELEINDGDFLFGRANTRELVGACTVVQNPPRRLLLCDKVFRFQFKPDAQVDRRYLDFALKSPPVREQIEAVASGTSSSMKNISKAKTLRLRVPLPPLSEQRRIVSYLNELQVQVDELSALQETTQAEMDSLLASVLDQAFKGQL